MKYYASISKQTPLRILVGVFGRMDQDKNNYFTPATDSLEHLRAQIGTVQSRLELLGKEFGGARILPFGAKPSRKKILRRFGPLKAQMDYGVHKRGTSINILEMRSSQRILAQEPLEHPDTVIIPPNEFYQQGVTERDIYGYYNRVAPALIDQYVKYDLDGMVLMKVDDKTIMKRHASIEVLSMKVGDQSAFDKLNRGRTVEFHGAIGSETRLVWCDLDPKEEFPFEDVKSIAAELAQSFEQSDLDLIDIEIRFSGKSGLHVYGILEHPIDTDDASNLMEKIIQEYLDRKQDDRLTMSITKDPGQMRLDISTLRETGALRAAYSLAYPTGLVCLPIPPSQLSEFEKSDATINKVLKNFKGGSRIQSSDVLRRLAINPEAWKVLLSPLQKWWQNQPLNQEEKNAIYSAYLAYLNFGKINDFIELNKLAAEILFDSEKLEKSKTGKWWEDEPVEKEFNRKKNELLDSISQSSIEIRIDFLKKDLESGGEKRTAKDLSEYQHKRKFEITPEPRGNVVQKSDNIFVVQKHQAKTAGLHYDLRLAHEGVLKSWAVPKLMDLVGGKRPAVLAIEVEPHPIEYAKFEGSIPTGQYGEGDVMIWDQGQYDLEKMSDRSIKFELHGQKMDGKFSLVHTGSNKWLLRRSQS